jgi:hypothetical protein
MSEIQAGEGYRLIDKAKDKKKPGDEYLSRSKEWFRASNNGKFLTNLFYRRRIPAKPEAMEIDGHAVSLDNGSVRIEGLFLRKIYFFSGRTKAIRQFGEWLISVADWREAQEGENDQLEKDF